MKKKKEEEKCDCCEEEPVVKKLTLMDGEGTLLDQVNFCESCWDDREIFIDDNKLSY